MNMDGLEKDKYITALKDTPIEVLFKSIILLQQEEGYESIINKLKKKLEKEFKKTKIEKNKVYKQIDNFKYYPNGILEYEKRCERYSILLSEYDFELKNIKKKKINIKRKKFSLLKEINLLWYWQVKEYYNIKYKSFISYEEARYESILNDINFLEKYFKLGDKAKSYVSQYNVVSKIDRIMEGWEKTFFTARYYDNKFYKISYTYCYLTNEEIETINNICSCELSDMETIFKLRNFATEKLENIKDNTINSIISKNFDYHSDLKYEKEYIKSYKKLYSFIKNTEDINVRKALINAKLFPEELFAKECIEIKTDIDISDKIDMYVWRI